MKLTYKKLIGVVLPALKEIDLEVDDKLTKEVIKTSKEIVKLVEHYNERLIDIHDDNAATDNDGLLLYDANGNYRFTREGMKAKNSEVRNLQNEEVNLITRIGKYRKLKPQIQEALKGLYYGNDELAG